MTTRGALLAGAENFGVEEIPAYEPCGSGEHLYVRIEKRGLTSDEVADQLAKACRVKSMAVSCAGRKDRHAVTSQWFSVHFGDETGLASLQGDHLRVLAVSRHRNKLKPGHLRGNRFRLVLGGVADCEGLKRDLARLAQEGVPNRFGAQRFGTHRANLAVAAALGRGDLATAVRFMVDAAGLWRPGEPLPSNWVPGPEGRAIAHLRRRDGDWPGALRAAGDAYRRLIASAAQSAVFNAILDARIRAGLLHVLRAGDLALNIKGAPFVCAEADLPDLNRRAAPGVLDVVASGPLPGTQRLGPAPAVAEEERGWSAGTGIDWAWFGRGGALESPGDRRGLIMRFLEAPALAEAGEGRLALTFALPSGGYATTVLEELGVAVPADRKG